MFISACEIICTSRADKCLWSPTCQYTCSFRAVAPAALAETNTTDQQTWKSCKLSARRPRQIFKLDTTANSNSGLETVVFSQFVTVLNHDSVCVCVCVQATPFFVGLMVVELVVGMLKTGASVVTISDGITSISAGMISRLPTWVFGVQAAQTVWFNKDVKIWFCFILGFYQTFFCQCHGFFSCL